MTERATQYAAVGMIVYILLLKFDYISILLEDTTVRLRQRSDRPCRCYIIISIELWPVLEGLPRTRPPHLLLISPQLNCGPFWRACHVLVNPPPPPRNF